MSLERKITVFADPKLGNFIRHLSGSSWPIISLIRIEELLTKLGAGDGFRTHNPQVSGFLILSDSRSKYEDSNSRAGRFPALQFLDTLRPPVKNDSSLSVLNQIT